MSYFKDLNPYQIHQKLINEYILKRPGDVKKLYMRDTSKDKTDSDVIRENHQFLWNEEDVDSWEKQLAKRYYDKLFKEYCIADLTRYKENKIALRWRIERELVTGKGQFICGNKTCDIRKELKSWEVNFAYIELGEKKNALIKLRLCPVCSNKLNYNTKKREVKRMKTHSKRNKVNKHNQGHSPAKKESSTVSSTTIGGEIQDNDESVTKRHEDDKMGSVAAHQQLEQIFWNKTTNEEEKTREEEFDDYLADLLL